MCNKVNDSRLQLYYIGKNIIVEESRTKIEIKD